jgi:transcriptional regulator with XRE-family HTH domain
MTLAEYRTTLGWSQAELARRAGISNPTVSKAENGEPINGRSANLICNALSEGLGRRVNLSDIKGLNVNV